MLDYHHDKAKPSIRSPVDLMDKIVVMRPRFRARGPRRECYSSWRVGECASNEVEKLREVLTDDIE